MIVIVDYRMGNLGSILNMLKKVGVKAMLSKSPADITAADRLILPGVGAFDAGMRNLRELGYLDVLHRKVLVERTPVLGICLGMQLFSERSEEGSEPGLGWVPAKTIRFQFSPDEAQFRVPHMGWNTVRICRPTPLFSNPQQEHRFYFVHSYHMCCADSRDVLTSTNYGLDFTSAVHRGNIVGTQFHPEKSHRFGMEFLRSFVAWSESSEE